MEDRIKRARSPEEPSTIRILATPAANTALLPYTHTTHHKPPIHNSFLTIPFTGDIPTLLSARRAVRDNFDQNRSLPSSSPESTEQIQYAQEVAKILRENLVQGRAMDGDGDRYSRSSYTQLRSSSVHSRGYDSGLQPCSSAWRIGLLCGFG